MRTRVSMVLAGALIVLLSLPASAVPPDGPSADTPGTGSSVSPKTLQPGQTISFVVSGFPAGETLNIKIDDGASCSQSAVHGACVYHQQRIPASGTVRGSFALPPDIAPGAHWLRFLASTPAPGGNGVLGFTRRGGADFTVVRPGAGGDGGATGGATSGAGASSSGGAGVAPGQTSGSGESSVTGEGGVVTIEPGETDDESTDEESTDDDAASIDATVATAADSDDGSGFPVVGAVVLGVLVAVAGGGAWLALRRRPTGA